MKKLAIMQPYFFPYIGYFQLMNAVDAFVVYDNIKFTKKGWIHRNRILLNGKDKMISLPIKKDSDYLDIVDRCLADNPTKEINKLLRTIKSAYFKAPFFEQVFPIVEDCFSYSNKNLFEFVYNSLLLVSDYLRIQVKFVKSSSLPISRKLKSEDRVIATCNNMNADIYLNPIGGIDLYSKPRFLEQGIELDFLKTKDIVYTQFTGEFLPNLSIIDVMMFNSVDNIQDMLHKYEIL